MRNRKWFALLLSICLLTSAIAASAGANNYYNYYQYDYPEYTVQSYKPNGYCYLYDQPSSITGRNLGRYNNGESVQVIDWYASNDYAFVLCANNSVGYMSKNSLASIDAVYDTCRVYSTNPKGYCYLYDQPNSTKGKNLGRYNNGEFIDIIDWDASEKFAKVYCQSTGRYGYIGKSALISQDDYQDYYDDEWNKSQNGSGSSYGGYHISLNDTSLYDIYYVLSLEPYGYCYLYDQPSSVNGTNLGRYNNDELIYVVNWDASDHFALVLCQDGKIGYINKDCLTQNTDFDYDICTVYSTNPNGYCYLYDKPSSVNGTNLGRHNNGETVYIINWNATDDYAYVKCENGKIGYIRKGCLSY